MLKGINILVADDNKLNQKIVCHILQKQDAAVTTVMNGLEAVEALKQGVYDIVLMDLHMPFMDGYTAARAIRNELLLRTPIVALTASINAEEDTECLSCGMNACISKPFDADRLCSLILKLVKNDTVAL